MNEVTESELTLNYSSVTSVEVCNNATKKVAFASLRLGSPFMSREMKDTGDF